MDVRLCLRREIRKLPPSSVTGLSGSAAVHSYALAVQLCCINALDAGATEVKITCNLKNLSATIGDNGIGIPAEDFPLLGQRHCSSKTEAGDVLGRSGCFLSSLSEVATVDIVSKARGAFRVMRKTLKAGCLNDFGLSSAPRNGQGTVVTFEKFLSRHPVRLNLLTPPRRRKELHALREQLLGLFASISSVSLMLHEKHSRQCLLELPKGRSEADMLQQVFGDAAAALSFQASADAGRVSISGHVAAARQPLNLRSGRQILVVNGHPAICSQVVKLIAALQALVLQGGHNRQRAIGDALSSCHVLPAMLLQVAVPADTVHLSAEEGHCVATFLQWPSVCKALLRGLSESWQEDVTEGMLRAVLSRQPGTVVAISAAAKAKAAAAAAEARHEQSGSMAKTRGLEGGLASNSFGGQGHDGGTRPAKRQRCAVGPIQPPDLANVQMPLNERKEEMVKETRPDFPTQFTGIRRPWPTSGPAWLSSEPRTTGIVSAALSTPQGDTNLPTEDLSSEEQHRSSAAQSSSRQGLGSTCFRGRSVPFVSQSHSFFPSWQAQHSPVAASIRTDQLLCEASRMSRRMPALHAVVAPVQHIVDAVSPTQSRNVNAAVAKCGDAAAALEASFMIAEAKSGSGTGEVLSRSGSGRACATARTSVTTEPSLCMAPPILSISRQSIPFLTFRKPPISPQQLLPQPFTPSQIPQQHGIAASAQTGWYYRDWVSLGHASGCERPKSAPPYASPSLPARHRNPLAINDLRSIQRSTIAAIQKPPQKPSTFSEDRRPIDIPVGAPALELPAGIVAAEPHHLPPHQPQQSAGMDSAAAVPCTAEPPSPQLHQRQPASDPTAHELDHLGAFSQDSEGDDEFAAAAAIAEGLLPALAPAPPAHLDHIWQEQQQRQSELQSTDAQQGAQTAWVKTEAAALSSVRRRCRSRPDTPQHRDTDRNASQSPAQVQKSARNHLGLPSAPFGKLPEPMAPQSDDMSNGPAPFYPPLLPTAGAVASLGNAALPTSRPPLRSLLDNWSNPALTGAGRAAEPLSVEALIAPSNGTIRPDAVHREDLQSASVVGQMDAKFVILRVERAATKAGTDNSAGWLAIMDQHAADERIRLEALHDSLLLPNGDPRAIDTCQLAPPHRLLLTEGEKELLDRFHTDVARWGWIVTSSASRLAVVRAPTLDSTLLTATDLKMYLHLLDSTGGSARQPPRVAAILNSRACRSAIMFGDTLSRQQCADLLRRLQGTRRFDICAHGRPTVTPLIDLDVLMQLYPDSIPSS